MMNHLKLYEDNLNKLKQYVIRIEGSHYQVNINLWDSNEDPTAPATPIWREYTRSELISALKSWGMDKKEAETLIALHHGDRETLVVSPEYEKTSLPLRPAGYQVINGTPWFLRESREPLRAIHGNPAPILQEVCRMFGNEAPLLLGWLKGAYTRQLNFAAEARGGEPLFKKVASQTLAIVGAPGTGKTHVLLDLIFAGLLGDYTNMPAAWLSGNSRFNDWALKSNIWVADDAIALQNIRERKQAATILKQAGYSSKLTVECKNKAVVNLDYPCERIFVVNLQEYALRALPAYEENSDKYLFLHNCAPSGLMTEWAGDIDRMKRELTEAMPAFAHWLLAEYTLPEWAVHNTTRHTVTDFGYMSPAVQAALAEQDEAGILLARLRKCYMNQFTKDAVRNKWLSQEELRSVMEGIENRADCTTATKMGSLLTECINRWPHLIGVKTVNGYRKFCLLKDAAWENPLCSTHAHCDIACPDAALLEAALLPPGFNPLPPAVERTVDDGSPLCA